MPVIRKSDAKWSHWLDMGKNTWQHKTCKLQLLKGDDSLNKVKRSITHKSHSWESLISNPFLLMKEKASKKKQLKSYLFIFKVQIENHDYIYKSNNEKSNFSTNYMGTIYFFFLQRQHCFMILFSSNELIVKLFLVLYTYKFLYYYMRGYIAPPILIFLN